MATTKEEEFKKKFLDGEHIDDDLELTEEIIGKLGVGRTSKKKAFENLVRNRKETWRNLLDLESKEEAIVAAGGDTDSGKAIWNAVQDYKKRAARLEGQPVRLPNTVQRLLELRDYKAPIAAVFENELFVETQVYQMVVTSLENFRDQIPTDKTLVSVPIVYGALGVGKTNTTARACIDVARKSVRTLYTYVSMDQVLAHVRGLSDYSKVDGKPVAVNVLAYCLWFAFLDTKEKSGLPKSFGECNLFEVFAQLQRNDVEKVFLHLDEVQIDPTFVKEVVRGCAASTLEKVRVFPVLSGLSTLKLNFTVDLNGSSWSTNSLLLVPFEADDEKLFEVFLHRMGFRGESARDWRSKRELQLLFTDCGGVPRIVVALASVAKQHSNLWNLWTSLDKFGRNEAAVIFSAVVNHLRQNYYGLARLHTTTGCNRPDNDDANVQSHLSFQTETVPLMKKLTLDVLLGEPVEDNARVLPHFQTKYSDCFNNGLLFRSNGNEAVPFLPMFVIGAICGHWPGKIVPEIWVNPFKEDFEAFEVAAICAIFARIQRWMMSDANSFQSISTIRWKAETRLQSPETGRQVLVEVECPKQFDVIERNAPIDARKDGAWIRLTRAGFKGLDAVCCLLSRWKFAGEAEWKFGRLKIGLQAKSGEVDCDTVIHQGDVETAIEKAATALLAFGDNDASDILLIDIVSDRKQQQAAYNFESFVSSAKLKRTTPFAISLTTRENVEAVFGPALASRKRMRFTEPLPVQCND